jgi:hypothetical protein
MDERRYWQRPCSFGLPHFPDWPVADRHRLRSIHSAPEQPQSDDRDPRAMGAQVGAHPAGYWRSLSASPQACLRHCGDRSSKVRQKLRFACRASAGPQNTALAMRISARPVPPIRALRESRVMRGCSGRLPPQRRFGKLPRHSPSVQLFRDVFDEVCHSTGLVGRRFIVETCC